MAKCPTGVVCTDWKTVFLVTCVLIGVFVYCMSQTRNETKIFIQKQEPPVKPDVYKEPVSRYPVGIPTILTRTPELSRYGQIGILTGEGGSSSSAAPDRTILPLYGREIDSRRGRWNYFTRTDGANPVQVPIRYKTRVCDDDINGCDEIFSEDSVHVPSLGRSFHATIYKKSLFV